MVPLINTVFRMRQGEVGADSGRQAELGGSIWEANSAAGLSFQPFNVIPTTKHRGAMDCTKSLFWIRLQHVNAGLHQHTPHVNRAEHSAWQVF